MKVKKYAYDEKIENDKREESIKGEWLSDYMSFVADPIIFKKDNLLRLGFDPITLEKN